MVLKTHKRNKRAGNTKLEEITAIMASWFHLFKQILFTKNDSTNDMLQRNET